jgi:hypothetical protein
VALRLTTDSGERHILETPDGMSDAEAVQDLIRRTWLGEHGWAQTSSGMVNLDHVVRIEAAGVSELSAAIADEERDDEERRAARNGTIDQRVDGSRLI